jgi:5-methylcytosine-specific restriction endonuclease McrBC regulatory subunit McrC
MTYTIESSEWHKVKTEFNIMKKKLQDKDNLIYFHETNWNKLENQLIESKAQNIKDKKRINELEHTLKAVLEKLQKVIDMETNNRLLGNIEIKALDIYS